MGAFASKRRRRGTSIDEAWRVLYIPKANGRKGLKHALKVHKPRRYTIYETSEYFVLAIGRPNAED